jgi:phosphoribosylformylglycinamidine cyclo-ligase
MSEYDLVGTIVGAVEKRKVITGKTIKPGDVIIGLPSGGLQTNGFSLARKVIFDQCGLTSNDLIPGTRLTTSEALLAIHRSFLRPVSALMAKKIPIQGMAHITGGGFADNIPRVLPDKCNAAIDRAAWTPPTIFTFIERQGKVDRDEMYRVFNMGIGYVIIVRARDAKAAMELLKKQHQAPFIVGKVESGHRRVLYKN